MAKERKPKRARGPAPQNRGGTGAKRKAGGKPFRKGNTIGAATRFAPGSSGNKGGRPRTSLLSQAFRNKLGDIVPDDPLKRTYAEYSADVAGEKIVQGDTEAIAEFFDRTEGRPRISADVTAHVQMTSDNISEISDEELQERIRRRIEAIKAFEKDEAEKLALSPAPEAA